MTAKIIRYIPKNTAADTNYREISDDDKQWLLAHLIKALTIMGEYDTYHSDDEDAVWVRDQWWHKKTKVLHKSQRGPNTPCSTVSGIVNNLMFKTPLQRDLSERQMQDIETITQGIHAVHDDYETVRFQIHLGV
jgi:hypothetical protein